MAVHELKTALALMGQGYVLSVPRDRDTPNPILILPQYRRAFAGQIVEIPVLAEVALVLFARATLPNTLRRISEGTVDDLRGWRDMGLDGTHADLFSLTQ